ncbi:putative autotransporter protein [Minicystis rosea]|nr:putative autotransporter protein [Minicystis rosea]
MRTSFLALSVSLVTVLAVGCGDGKEEPTGSGTVTGTGGHAGHSGDGGNGGDGGALSDPTKGAWRDGFGVPGLAGFGARASSVVRGEDGRVYIGGIFTDAGGVPANNVAVWTGTTWQALGDGLPGFVNAIAFGPDGALYAGGWLGSESDPTNHLARWDGTKWTLLPGEVMGKIRALATQGDRLLVAAESGDIAGLGTAGIAAYGADGWSAIGEGGADFDVASILVTGDDTFCIGGGFGTIDNVPAANAACWDGTAWSQLGDGLPGGVSRLVKAPTAPSTQAARSPTSSTPRPALTTRASPR